MPLVRIPAFVAEARDLAAKSVEGIIDMQHGKKVSRWFNALCKQLVIITAPPAIHIPTYALKRPSNNPGLRLRVNRIFPGPLRDHLPQHSSLTLCFQARVFAGSISGVRGDILSH